MKRTILRVACLLGVAQLGGCAVWAQLRANQREAQRQQRVKDRTYTIELELVTKYEFQHSCEEVSDAFAPYLIENGYDIMTQTKTQVVTGKRYNADYSSSRVASITLHAAGAGCRAEATVVDRFQNQVGSQPATSYTLAVIEKLEPERVEALRAEAKRRAEAENPPPKEAVAAAAKPDAKDEASGDGDGAAAAETKAAETKTKTKKPTPAAANGEEEAAPPPAPKTKTKKPAPAAAAAEEEAAPPPAAESRPNKPKAVVVASAEGEPAAGESEAEGPPPAIKKKPRPPVETEAEESAGPAPIPPTLDIAAAPIAGINRSLSFVDQKTNTINGSETNMRPYGLPYGPAASLNLVWYPFAPLTKGFAQNIGFEGGIQQGLFIQASIGPGDPQLPNATFGTSVHEYEGGMRYRIPFGHAGNQVWVSVTAGEHAFTFTSSPDCALSTPNTCRPNLEIPDTIYHYVRPGLGLRLELPASFALAASAGFRDVFNGGGDQFAVFFPHRTVWGADAAFYLGYRVISSIEIRAGGELMMYRYAMNSTMADAQAVMAGGTRIKVASSAIDRYVSGTLGLAFLYGGTRR